MVLFGFHRVRAIDLNLVVALRTRTGRTAQRRKRSENPKPTTSAVARDHA